MCSSPAADRPGARPERDVRQPAAAPVVPRLAAVVLGVPLEAAPQARALPEQPSSWRLRFQPAFVRRHNVVQPPRAAGQSR